MNAFQVITDAVEIARDNDINRSKVQLGAAVGGLPRSNVKIATTAEAHAASAALRG